MARLPHLFLTHPAAARAARRAAAFGLRTLVFPLVVLLTSSSLLHAAEADAATSPQPATQNFQPVTASAPADALRLPETLLPALRPLLDAALKESPRVLSSRLTLLAADANAQAARAPQGWQLGFGAGADARQEMRRDIPGTHYSFKFSYGFALTKSLWDWDAKANRARYAELQRQLAEDDLAEARRALILELRAQYAGLIVRAAELEQAQCEEAQLARRLEIANERATRGEITALDRTDAQDAFALAQIATARADSQLRRASEDFATLAGLKNFSAVGLPADVPAVPDLAAALRPPAAAVVGASAALAAPNTQLAAARTLLAAEQVRRKPTLDFVAGTAQDEVNYTANIGSKVGVQTNYVGLRLNWNVWDSHASDAAVSRANAAVRQAELVLSQAELALRRQLADGWEDLDLGRRELAALEARLANAATRLASDRSRRDAGEISSDDWEQRQLALGRLRLDTQKARAAQLLRTAEYALLLRRGTLPAAQINFP
jgi:outer membrane protein TolC